jgi:bifunctional DNase/RNase
MIQVKVKYVGIEEETGHPLVLLSNMDESEYLPIVIGPYEAGAILAGMEGRRFSRPLTHDLAAEVIRSLGGCLTCVTISGLADNTFYAYWHIVVDGEKKVIDARPSDALAIALRLNADIYVDEDVAAVCMLPAERFEGVDREKEEFLRFLENLTPDDFRRNLE